MSQPLDPSENSNPANASTGEVRQLPLWVLYLSVLLATLSISQLLIRGGSLVGFPHELRYGEAIVLDQSRRTAEEPGLYPPVGQEPWLLDQYSPVYLHLTRWTGGLFSSPYGSGRAISLISTLISASMLMLLISRRSGLAAGLICGATMLTMMEFLRFGFLMRVDPLALAFAMVGMWCSSHRTSAMRFAGAAAFFLAVYTRQTTIALLLVTYIQMWKDEGRSALRWPVGLLGTGLVAYAILNGATGGGFHQHAVLSNLFRFEWDQGLKKAFGTFMPWRAPLFFGLFLALIPDSAIGKGMKERGRVLGFLALGLSCIALIPALQAFLGEPIAERKVLTSVFNAHIILLLYAVGKTALSRGEDQLAAIRILFALITMVLIGRLGSDLNYLFESGVLMLLVCGDAIGRISPRRGQIIAVLLAVQVVAGFYLSGQQLEFQPERLSEMQERRRILVHLENFSDPVLSEEPWALAETGRPLVIGPYTARQMYEVGMWDGEDLIEAIESRKFTAIVRAQQRVAAGYERDESGAILIDETDGLPRPYFGPWTFNEVRSLPPKLQKAIEKNYQRVPRTAMIERVTKYFLEGREIWQPIPR